MTGVVSDAPTLVTPLTGVPRIHRVHKHASIFGFVLDTLLELTERSLRMPVSVPKTVSNTVELLENDTVTSAYPRL
jgi:phage-related holin